MGTQPIDDGWTAPKPTIRLPFSDQPVQYQVGSLFGARTFIADDQGNLAGATFQKIWNPGINVAECWKITGWMVHNIGLVPHRPDRARERYFTGEYITAADGTKTPKFDSRAIGWEWELGQEKGITVVPPVAQYGGHQGGICSDCGLHGFLAGSLTYANRNAAVSGIIRAFGTVAVQERGFRATHAEIRALYMPAAARDRSPGLDRVLDDAPIRVGFGRVGQTLTAHQADAIAARYPLVPIYTDLDQMLRDHPTDPPRKKKEIMP